MLNTKDWSATDLIPYLEFALPNLPKDRIDRLIEAYSELRRTYHYYVHILSMIEEAEAQFAHGLSRDEWRILLIMILYHDVVYEIGKEFGYNERMSADYAVSDLAYANFSGIETIVWAGIYATASHSLAGVPEPYRRLVSILLDLDLKGLGADWFVFSQGTKGVWGEYKTHATREQFDTGRKAWAQQFLLREKIYHTPEFTHLEAPARANLTRLATE